jgi:hypothetical protein
MTSKTAGFLDFALDFERLHDVNDDIHANAVSSKSSWSRHEELLYHF